MTSLDPHPWIRSHPFKAYERDEQRFAQSYARLKLSVAKIDGPLVQPVRDALISSAQQKTYDLLSKDIVYVLKRDRDGNATAVAVFSPETTHVFAASHDYATLKELRMRYGFIPSTTPVPPGMVHLFRSEAHDEHPTIDRLLAAYPTEPAPFPLTNLISRYLR